MKAKSRKKHLISYKNKKKIYTILAIIVMCAISGEAGRTVLVMCSISLLLRFSNFFV